VSVIKQIFEQLSAFKSSLGRLGFNTTPFTAFCYLFMKYD